jgi:hypothetical protein
MCHHAPPLLHEQTILATNPAGLSPPLAIPIDPSPQASQAQN